MTIKRPTIALAGLALLAACGEEPPSDDSRSASGEVLEGTISDSMLPVDRGRSEPPRADPEAAERVERGEATGAAIQSETEGEGTEGEVDETEQAPAELAPESDE